MRIGIIGYGRFGKTLYKLLKDDFEILIFDKDTQLLSTVQEDSKVTTLAAILEAQVLFLCIPINQLENFIKDAGIKLKNKVVIDTLSVKAYPAKILSKCKDTEVILTHPMFGPDSTQDGFKHLTIVMHNLSSNPTTYAFWTNYFTTKQLRVVELTPHQHDKLAANSQGIVHFLGRVLQNFEFESTPIDTLGARKLKDIMEQTCNDSFELFYDLQTYNPYTSDMRIKLGKSYETLFKKLLPTRVSDNYTVYGIQGGKGSFNEEALLSHIDKSIPFKIKYLYTTKNVLDSLSKGTIDFGLFAVSNTLGGIVDETIEVLGDYKFEIVTQITLNIRHFLMKRRDVTTDQITKIIAHPQVLKQCEENLSTKYPRLAKISGGGDLIDTAKAAQALHVKKLSHEHAILGPRVLAELYAFDIIDSNLQDREDNRTTFLLVKR